VAMMMMPLECMMKDEDTERVGRMSTMERRQMRVVDDWDCPANQALNCCDADISSRCNLRRSDEPHFRNRNLCNWRCLSASEHLYRGCNLYTFDLQGHVELNRSCVD